MEMERSNKDAWLSPEAGDLKTAVVEDVPVPGQSVKVRGLPAAYSSQAASEAVEQRQVGRDTINVFNQGSMEVLQFMHGVIEPTFTQAEVEQIAEHFGPAYKKIIAKIDELSAVSAADFEAANERFQSRRASENGSEVGESSTGGSGGRDLSARAGARIEDASGGVG